MARVRCSDAELDELRRMHVPAALDRLGLRWKDDRTFVPTKDRQSARLHVDVGASTVELLHTGPKWFDRIGNGGHGKGGGGAIDLAMYLLGLNFKQAIERLRDHAATA
jgi:hypothetical protein